MERIHFEVPGPPTALKRHRTITRAKGGRALPFARSYDPSVGDKADFLAMAREHAPEQPIQGPIVLAVIFWMPALKSFNKTLKRVTEWVDHDYKQKELTPSKAIPLMAKVLDNKPANLAIHVKKPDGDNLIKLVKDALNKTFWVDDSQVQAMYIKLYSYRPRTEMEILYAPQE